MSIFSTSDSRIESSSQSNQLLLFACDCPGFNSNHPESQETLQSWVVSHPHPHSLRFTEGPESTLASPPPLLLNLQPSVISCNPSLPKVRWHIAQCYPHGQIYWTLFNPYQIDFSINDSQSLGIIHTVYLFFLSFFFLNFFCTYFFLV